MVRQIIVIGAGRFGTSIACQLNSQGAEVLVLDRNAECIHGISEQVTHAVQGDATDESILRSLGVRNFDAAVVAIGSDIQSSILITLLLKEIGVRQIISKAQNERHAKVLYKIGADRVVLPERDMGIRIAQGLVNPNTTFLEDLTPGFRLMEINAPRKWQTHTIRDLEIERRYGVRIVGLKRDGRLDLLIDPELEILKEDDLILYGPVERLVKLRE